MTSKLVVNTIESDTGISSVSFASSISMSSTSKFFFSAAGIDIGADTNINRPAAGVLGFNINSSEKVRITSAGDVGIGVNDPDAKLEVLEDIFVKGSSGDGDTGIQIRSGSSALSNQHQIRTGGGNGNMLFLEAVGGTGIIAMKTAGSERLRIDSSGNVTISTGNLTIPDSIIHSGDTDTKIRFPADNTISFETAGYERLRFDSQGSVIINGTTSFGNPVKLQVRGASSAISDGAQIFDIASTAASNGGTRLAFGVNEDNYTWIRSYESAVGARDMVFATNNEKLRIMTDGELRLLSENGNNSDTPGIRFRGGSSTQKANFARIHSRMVSNWGGQLQFKVKNDNGSLSDAYQTAMIMNHNAHVTKPNQPSFHVGSPNDSGSSSGQVWKSHSNAIYSNVGSHYNNSTGRFTAPVDGQYFFFHWGMTQSNSAGTTDVYSRKNGSRDQIGTSYNSNSGGTNGYHQFGCSYVRTLSAGDYVDVYTSSGSIYYTTDGRHGGWGGWLIG